MLDDIHEHKKGIIFEKVSGKSGDKFKNIFLLAFKRNQATMITFAITSAVSLKSTHPETLDLARNSSIKRIPIL